MEVTVYELGETAHVCYVIETLSMLGTTDSSLWAGPFLEPHHEPVSFNFVLLYSQIGDRVMAFVNYNAWAEVVCTPVEFVYKIPDDMSFSEAAAFPMNFVTAYTMLFEIANLREGMSVLVHSAGGGVVSSLLVILFLQGCDGTNGVEIDSVVLMWVVIGRNNPQ